MQIGRARWFSWVWICVLGGGLHEARAEVEISPASTPGAIHLLKIRRERIRERVAVCPDGPWKGDYSHWHGGCESGDSTAYNGMACLAATLAGDQQTAHERCSNIERAQDATGRWWRAPSLVGVDRGGASTFSRDMSRGVFAYLLAKGRLSPSVADQADARERSTRWLNWILGDGDVRFCPEDKNGCEITTGIQNHIFNVYRLIGTLPSRPAHRGAYWNPPYTRQEIFLRGIYGSEWYLRYGLTAEIPLLALDRDLRGKFYPYNLKASSVVIHRVGNMNADSSVRNRRIAHVLGAAAKMIHEAVPDNPYYEFIAKGVTRDVLLKSLERCPGVLPDVPLRFGAYRDWQWQRSSSERAWEYGDGHDCVYLINLMIARLEGRLRW